MPSSFSCIPSSLKGLQQIQIKLRWALFVTYTIIQSIMRSEMCSLHLTHPSGAVGSRHCGAWGAVGGSVPCSRVSPQSWTIPAGAGIQTHNFGLPRVSSPTLYPLGHDIQDIYVFLSSVKNKLLFLMKTFQDLSPYSELQWTPSGLRSKWQFQCSFKGL